MKKIFLIYFTLLFLIVFNNGCGVRESVESLSIEVINETSNTVKLNFYRRGFNSNTPPHEISGQGLLFEASDSSFSVPVSSLFEADSIRLVFDNDLVEIHTVNDSVSQNANNLFNIDSYQEVDGIFRYVINDLNFDNAIPCDESCN